VFVGGSLAPLGGQNFMEPLARGRIPVIGPHWDNFSWIGEAVFRQGLAVRVPDAEKAADALIAALENPPDRARVREAAGAFVADRSGGARMAGEMIRTYLDRTATVR
jgi:3-deoxy-D-manno-octulosonic-acid transferase